MEAVVEEEITPVFDLEEEVQFQEQAVAEEVFTEEAFADANEQFE